MAELEPDFQLRVWRYTYTERSGGGTILLNSPQESQDERHDTLVLRQVNSDAENKVWIQEQASRFFRRHGQASAEPLMDDAHGVLVRDGHAWTIPKQGEKAVTHEYCRGDRVWIDRSLVPTHNIEKDGNKIPVVDLESFSIFEVPFDYISFVPQLVKKDGSGEQHAVAVGPILNTFIGKRKAKTQIYFRWPADKPDQVSYVWLNRKDKNDLKEIKAFVEIECEVQKQEAFRNHWQALTKKLARLGLLFGDEIVDGPEDLFDSSSDSEGEDLALHWKMGPSEQENCCNMNPCPAFNNPELDLVATYIGGYQWMEHYHVQDEDTDECPRGAEHKGHCILRDDRTRCAYATDRVRHTCCKLRTNPLLPGPYGDPDDMTLSLWETTAADDNFIDVSGNVRTRMQLEDRDEIPPEMERLRQQLLAEQVAAEQNSPGGGHVRMTDAFQGSVGDAMTMSTTSGFPTVQTFGEPFNQPFNPPFDRTLIQAPPDLSLYGFQPPEALQFSAPMASTNPFDPLDTFASQAPDPSEGPY